MVELSKKISTKIKEKQGDISEDEVMYIYLSMTRSTREKEKKNMSKSHIFQDMSSLWGIVGHVMTSI